VERGTVEIAEAIAGAGFRALVASAGGPMAAEVARVGGVHVTLPLDTKSPGGILRNASALAAIIRAEEVAVVHARSRAPAWSALIAARRGGARFVTTYHGTYNEGLPGKRLYNSVMARGDRVIAISRFIAEVVRTRHGTPPERIRLISARRRSAALRPGRRAARAHRGTAGGLGRAARQACRAAAGPRDALEGPGRAGRGAAAPAGRRHRRAGRRRQ
jgi:hypothetical protein